MGYDISNDHPGSLRREPWPGAVWNGFEWVTPERYEEQRRCGYLPTLPPLQPAQPTASAPQPAPQPASATPVATPAPPAVPSPAQAAPAWGNDYPDGSNAPIAEQCGCGHPICEVCAIDEPDAADDVFAFPLEQMAPFSQSSHFSFRQEEHLLDTMRQLLFNIDPAPERGGLVETPQRAAKAWLDWTAGYAMDPAEVLKVFEDGAEGCDEMVLVRDIPVYSHCEHHLAPIFGKATIGYIPDRRIVGLSKFNRLVDIFARRLQVQERMTNQIAAAIMEHIQPKGCGVVVSARHMCMESRGVKSSETLTVTSSLLGCFREGSVRSEFLNLARTK